MMFTTCKHLLLLFVITLSSTSTVTSFTAKITRHGRIFIHKFSTKLQSRADSSDSVRKALEASKKYGASSKEARLAWEEVEEIDSSDNSAAYSGGVNTEECYND